MPTPTPQILIQAPGGSGSVNDILLEFNDGELEAMRRCLKAEDQLGERSMHEVDYLSMAFDAEWALSDFYCARLARIFPHQADVIRWVFHPETRGQAERTARGDAEGAAPPKPPA